MSPIRATLQELGDTAETKIYSLISGTGEFCSGLSMLSSKIVYAIETLLDPVFGVGLSEELVQDFLRITLPALVEAFLRRKTER